MVERRSLRKRLWLISFFTAAACHGAHVWQPAAHAQAAGEKATPMAESVLRKTANFFQKAKSVSADVEREQKVGGFTIKMPLSVALERPNHFAIESKGMGLGGAGITIICDGKTLSISVPQLNRYTQADAPGSIDGLKADPIVTGFLAGYMVTDLFATDPYKTLMEGVKTAKYSGSEEIDGVKTHHLSFTQDQFDWELWVPADGDPLVKKVRLDLSKSLARMPGGNQMKNLDMVTTFKNWQIDQPIAAGTFVFKPPAGSKKADSLFEGLAGGGAAAKPERSPLVGKIAPKVHLKLLDGGDFQLEDHRDKAIVMMDFWATWCGPCVQELPILAEVARAYKDKGVVFRAVNLQEKPEEIREFLKSKKLDFTVALDSAGETGSAYGAEAIPMLVLIDKKGVVQSVHVGYNPTIKKTLEKELDALLAGKDLAKEAAENAGKPKPAANSKGLKGAWSVDGPYGGLAADPTSGNIYALKDRGRCDVLDQHGKTIRSIKLEGASDQKQLRLGQRAGGSWFASFGNWGQSVLASRIDGSKVWAEAGGQGIDDVWLADLTGDGTDEVIVGYNGNTGLHVFSADGQRLWKNTELGNVWHVSAGDVDGDGKPEVVTTSARGSVHIFKSTGEQLKTLNPGIYANMVRTVPGRHVGVSKGDAILVIGTGQGRYIVALDGDGKQLWKTAFPSDVQHCDSLAVSPDGTRAVAGLRGGLVCVIDLNNGQIAAQANLGALIPVVAWSASASSSAPLLLVATGSDVQAFWVKADTVAGK